jgi:hypothetical protein
MSTGTATLGISAITAFMLLLLHICHSMLLPLLLPPLLLPPLLPLLLPPPCCCLLLRSPHQLLARSACP